MKKSILALSIAMAASSVSAAEIYNEDGKVVNVGGFATSITEVSDGNTKSIIESAISLDGSAEITGNLKALGFAKYRFDYNSGEDKTPFLDRGFVGFEGDFGKVVYGKADGAFGTPHMSDVMVIGSDAIKKNGNAADGGESVINYSHAIGPVSFGLAHELKTEKTATTTTQKLNAAKDALIDEVTSATTESTSTAANVKFSQDMFAVAASYGVDKENDTELKQLLVGASVTIDDLFLGAAYNKGTYNDSDVKDYVGYEVAAKYSMDKLTFDVWYGIQETNDKQTEGGYGAGVVYAFTSGVNGKLGYRNATTDGKEDVFKVVLGYDF